MDNKAQDQAATIPNLPLDELLSGCEDQDAHRQASTLRQFAESISSTKPETSEAIFLVANVMQMSFSPSSLSEPFTPFFQTSEGRSLALEDISASTARALGELGQSTQNPLAKARLLDVAWCRGRNHLHARAAIIAYQALATDQFDPEDWVDCAEFIERALRLSKQIADETLASSINQQIELWLEELDGNDTGFLTLRLVELLIEGDDFDKDICLKATKGACQIAQSNMDYDKERQYLETITKLYNPSDDADAIRASKVRISETFLEQARARSGETSNFAAAHFFEKAHEVLRAIPGMREEAEAVYRELRTAQKASVSEMRKFQTQGFDLTEDIRNARLRASQPTLHEALLALAEITVLPDQERETALAREMMQRYPVQGLFGGVKLDRDGRIIGKKTPALTSDPNQYQRAVWERAVEQALFSCQVYAQSHIIPAINQISYDHSISLKDLDIITHYNPFIPEGHEAIYAKGIYCGLRFDIMDALCILVPQIENSLRHVAGQFGAETTTRDKNGIQNKTQLGTLLSDPRYRLTEELPVNVLFGLKALFSDQSGADVRNSVAHGMLSYNDFYSLIGVYAWWFIYRLCVSPISVRLRKSGDEKSE